MILYHAISSYQLLNCIVHKMKFHNNDDTILILPDYINIKFPHFLELERQFFDKVITFENAKFSVRDENLFLENIDNVIDELLKKNNIFLDKCTEIIVGCAHYYFGIYLARNSIPFTFMEDACGVISRPEVLENIITKISKERNEVCKSLGLYDGSNKVIKHVICNLSAQKEGYESDNLVHFDVVDELSRLDSENIKKILEFFGVNKEIPIEANSIVILTQHFSNLKLLSFDEQKEIYQLIIDYFANNYPLVFKKHPDDLMYYEELIPGSKIVEEKFPSELIPFVFSNAPKSVMTVTSSAILSLLNYFEYPIRFNMNFETNYHITHRYYCSLKTISREVKDFGNNIFVLNTNDILLKNLAKYSDLNLDEIEFTKITVDERDIPENSVLFIDDFYVDDPVIYSEQIKNLLNSLHEKTLVFFLNSNKNHVYYKYPDKQIINFLAPLELNFSRFKNKESREIYRKENELIYVYCRDKDWLEMINEKEFEVILKNMDLKVNVEKLSDVELKFKVLEGILEATEKRLEHYIELESELREKLSKLDDKGKWR